MNHRTYQLLRNGWTVIGYTYAGGVYCPDCCPPSITGGDDDPRPLFASDDLPNGWGCDECGKEIN